MSKTALDQVVAKFGDVVLGTHAQHGDETASIRPDQVGTVARYLRDDLHFEMCSDVTCVDYLGEEPRFELVYHFYSVSTKQRLRIKARVTEEAPELPSIFAVYPCVNWMEREVFDLYGVKFTGHPNLKRILLYEEFVGHPLRKDYPKEKRQPLVRRDAQG